MSLIAALAVLAAAVMHATWNAILRGSSGDRMWSMTLMCMASASVGVGMSVWFGVPAAASWPFLLASAGLQIAYCLLLVRAYRDGEFTQIYPVARGAAPVLVDPGRRLHRRRTSLRRGPYGGRSGGDRVAAMSWRASRVHANAIVMALVTAVFIAGYTLADGFGVRAAGDAGAYAGWLFVIQGAPMPLIFLAARRRWTLPIRAPETLGALGGGVLSILAYGTVVWALAHNPMAGCPPCARPASCLEY